MGRIYGAGEKPPRVHSDYHGPNAEKRYMYLRLGIVELVDYDSYRMKISWIQGAGSPDWVPISFAYVGPAGCMGMIPEEGAIGIFGFYSEGMGVSSTAKPFCLSFVPGNLAHALEFNFMKKMPDQLSTNDKNVIPLRFHGLARGEMIMASPLGSEIFLTKDVRIADQLEDTFQIRGYDQSMISTSVNNFVFADGASVSMGPVMRNKILLLDENGRKINPLASERPMPDGKNNIYLVPYGESIAYDTQFFTEYRVDVDELGNGIPDQNEINSENMSSSRDPVVTFSLGNYVGSNETTDQYGLVLKPILFKNLNDTEGGFSLAGCRQDNAIDEPSIRGLAYALHFHKSGAFLGIDKEGHYYINLPSTSASSIGSGRSMSILAQGNLKEIWGVAREDYNSWDLTAKGGIRWIVGAHNSIRNERSIDIQASSGMYVEINGADLDGNAKNELLTGNVQEKITGIKNSTINEQHLEIQGLKTETVFGSSTEHTENDRSISVNGVFSEMVIKEKQSRLGKRSTTITTGDDELTVYKGDIKETIKFFGNKKTTIIGPGGISESINAGNRKTSIKAGNYEVDIKAGNITLKTLAGTARLQSTGTATLKSTITAKVSAPRVSLGSIGPKGAVITGLPGLPSHLDYLVGIPLRGALSVVAGP